ncbi:MAG: 2-dehydropantoate 2-reductase [Bradyrhizobiaceae bacterium]|nr:2-dehydropantoate 2-reductase [Bradyrhizobiaceae bacterium]
MKICIYGAGAIGGYLGVLLKQAGADVSLIARGAHLKAIQANGLKLLIEGQEKVAKFPATSDPKKLGPQDYVIVALKAHQAWEVAEDMRPLFHKDTAVVTAQNGLPWWYFYGFEGQYANRRIESVDPGGRQWEAIGPERAIGCTVYPATEVVEPGVVKHIDGNKFGLGEPTRTVTPRVEALSKIFEAAGLKAPILPEIRNDIWLKLWGNLCFNPISALTHATLDVVATEPGTRNLSRNMMLEAEKIGRRIGVHFRVDVDRRINGAARVGAHKTSMLQDVEKGRPLEIDALLTCVQELGRLAEVETPHIDAVLALVQQMARVKGLYPVFPDLPAVEEVAVD